MTDRTKMCHSKEELVEELKKNGIIKSDVVANVMTVVDRANFCPRGGNYMMKEQRLGFSAVISSPEMHAYILEALKEHLTEGKKALDIGSGSGFLTTCMAIMVGETGKAVGIEHIPELVSKSKELIWLGNSNLLDSGRLIIKTGDGFQGYEPEAPYDVIYVGAGANEVPGKERTRHDMVLKIFDKRDDDSSVQQDIAPVHCMLLTNSFSQWPGKLLTKKENQLDPLAKWSVLITYPSLVYESKDAVNISNSDLLDSGCLLLKTYDGRQGYEAEALYDVIYVGAAASDVPAVVGMLHVQLELVDYLKECGVITSDTVANVMMAVDRANFCPRGGNYMVKEQKLGYGAVISSTEMVGETGKAVGIDHIPELVSRSIELIRRGNANLLDTGRLIIKTGDGRLGSPPEEPYDAINVSASASDVPGVVWQHLKAGGRLILAVGPGG